MKRRGVICLAVGLALGLGAMPLRAADQPGLAQLAGRAPEMDAFQALIGRWNVAQSFYRPKRQVWEAGPSFQMAFTARYGGMYIEADAAMPYGDGQSFPNTMIISYDKFRRVYRVAMMDGVVGLMDVFEGVRQGDVVWIDDVRTNTPGPNLRGELEYVRMALSFPGRDRFLIAAHAQRNGQWVEMLRYEFSRSAP
jgi:hypothetical protein